MVPELLIIEDNAADVLLLEEAFAEVGWAHRSHLLSDGSEALDHFQALADSRLPLPDLVLLDLNLPCLDGRDLLAVLRESPALAALPVVVLSGSEWEIEGLGPLGITPDRYLVKPSTFQGFVDAAGRIREILARSSRAPRIPDPGSAPPGKAADHC